MVFNLSIQNSKSKHNGLKFYPPGKSPVARSLSGRAGVSVTILLVWDEGRSGGPLALTLIVNNQLRKQMNQLIANGYWFACIAFSWQHSTSIVRQILKHNFKHCNFHKSTFNKCHFVRCWHWIEPFNCAVRVTGWADPSAFSLLRINVQAEGWSHIICIRINCTLKKKKLSRHGYWTIYP